MMLIAVGVVFLLLLNGRVFTNTVLFLACVGGSASLWLRALACSRSGAQRRLPILMLLLHVAVMAAFTSELPEAHRRQQRFNEKRQDLRP